jgi:hypothetical protein
MQLPETAGGQPAGADALALLRRRFEDTEDPETRAELAARALELTERQLDLARTERQRLDSREGRLWSMRNQLERFLIEARGRDWWRARRDRSRAAALPSTGD